MKMKKLMTRMLTRQHKCYSTMKRPKNIEEEREDLAVFGEFDQDDLNRFQRIIRRILPIKDEYVMVYDAMEVFFNPPLIRFYYNCRRRVIDFFNIRQHFRKIYWFFQRGFRGWSDRDIWSLDHYLCGWLPNALTKLKKDKVGTPFSCYPEGPEYIDEKHGGPNEKADNIAQENWESILQKIIDGFSAKRRMNCENYPFPYPDRKTFKDKRVYDKELKKFHVKKQAWEEKQRAIFREGISLFAKHFEDFWD